MGEIAEMMMNGTLCHVCGEYMGDSAGYAVACPGCSEREAAPIHTKNGRYRLAGEQFPEAARIAKAAGLVLVRRTEQHYQVWPRDKSWMLNFYPGNCRIYADRNHPKRAPFVGVRSPWSLLEAVEALVEKVEGAEVAKGGEGG